MLIELPVDGLWLLWVGIQAKVCVCVCVYVKQTGFSAPLVPGVNKIYIRMPLMQGLSTTAAA